MTVSEQYWNAVDQRAEWARTDARTARDQEIAETHAVLDEDDRESGRAPRADNHAAAVRLTDRATTRRAEQ